MQCLLKGGGREKNGKFISAYPEEVIAGASELLSYMSRDFAQDAIAKRMAMAIVDAFEMIDIEKAQGRRFVLAGRGQQLLELDTVMAPVERASEIVGDCQSAQATILPR